MNRVIFAHFFQILIMFLILLSLLFLSSCKKSNDNPVEATKQPSLFPEFYAEKGLDSDSSYISLQGVRVNNDTLELQATTWSIIEYGLVLVPHNSSKSIIFSLNGRCGNTSQLDTWGKVILSYRISPEVQDSLQQIGFTNFKDTLVLTKTRIARY